MKGGEELRVKEAAERLDRSLMTIHRWITAGKLNAIKIGKFWEISEEEIERVKREGL